MLTDVLNSLEKNDGWATVKLSNNMRNSGRIANLGHQLEYSTDFNTLAILGPKPMVILVTNNEDMPTVGLGKHV